MAKIYAVRPKDAFDVTTGPFKTRSEAVSFIIEQGIDSRHLNRYFYGNMDKWINHRLMELEA